MLNSSAPVDDGFSVDDAATCGGNIGDWMRFAVEFRFAEVVIEIRGRVV